MTNGPEGAAPQRRRVAVISGASSGIGRATAERFATLGWRLVLAARDAGALETLAGTLRDRGGEVCVVPTDIGDAAAVRALATAALTFGDTIDLWFANVGVGAVGRFEDVPVEAHAQVLHTNLVGHLHEAHAVLPIFLRQGHGVFVNMISMVGFAAAPLAAAYSASKFGLRGLSEALRAEMAAHPRIHVCDVYPALVDTPALDHAANYTGKAIHPPTPMLEPRRVAEAVVRLADHPRATTLVGAQNWGVRIVHALAPTLSLKLVDRWFEGYFAMAKGTPVKSGNLFQSPGDTPRVDGGYRKPFTRRLPLLLAAGTLAVIGGAALLHVRDVASAKRA